MKTKLKSVLQGSAGVFLAACLSAPALGADVQRHGESYVIYLPPTLPFNEVVDRVQTEILTQNWDVVNVQDLGLGLRKLGVWTENRILHWGSLIPALASFSAPSVFSVVKFQRLREVPLVARYVLGINRP